MSDLNISYRLRKVATYLPIGALFADIGSDHAYLPVFVCKRDKHARAIAGEINAGPYHSALEQVTKWNLNERIDVRLGDGLSVLQPAEVNQVVIAGMGGTLISDILEKGIDKLGNTNRIIVQPNINARQVRKWFYRNQFQLIDECVIEEDGYHYEILVAEKAKTKTVDKELSEKEYYLGPIILNNKNEAFINKWSSVLLKKKKIVEQMKNAVNPEWSKINQFEQEIEWLQEELNV